MTMCSCVPHIPNIVQLYSCRENNHYWSINFGNKTFNNIIYRCFLRYLTRSE